MDINRRYLADETAVVSELLLPARLADAGSAAVSNTARRLVEAVRGNPERFSPLERFLTEYDLASDEGVLLMCLAESLLRVPDAATADALIADKLVDADWASHLGSDDLLINASTWGLMLTGRLLPSRHDAGIGIADRCRRLVVRIGEPLMRNAIRHAMRIIGEQFVMGATIGDAIRRSDGNRRDYECFSYDMLGEAALTDVDAARYFDAYRDAITVLGGHDRSAYPHPAGISVKLSALHPRFEFAQYPRIVPALVERVIELALLAASHGLQVTIDAEETDVLEMTLTVFARVLNDRRLKQWDGLGIAVQAYQKRAPDVVRELLAMAGEVRRRIPVRLVKGAYWDSEIKLAQQRGLSDYPVFTRKFHTDVSYQACARLLLSNPAALAPQFATHNAYTIAYLVQVAEGQPIEFQRLHGMGEALYAALNDGREQPYRCRVYAPVGSHDVLLPYLVRRLLENGANTSFVHRIADREVPVAEIAADPTALSEAAGCTPHPGIRLPANLFGTGRRNSAGINFADRRVAETFAAAVAQARYGITAQPVVAGNTALGETHEVRNPATANRVIGAVHHAGESTVRDALEVASSAWKAWDATDPTRRAACLYRTADLFEQNAPQLVACCIAETGRTLVDAHQEVREAVDFLRYYGRECERLFTSAISQPGPVGEDNTLRLRARGVFACISPWNFPVSIFTGQIAAALAAGNAVIAKPAEQSSLTAALAVRLLWEAGIPPRALAFVPGDGPSVAEILLSDTRLAGVAFTGSLDTAREIARRLAFKPGPLATYVAETGGLNAMIADSSALPEQVVHDAIVSGFGSAGQRCSALRVLYLQSEVADRVIDLMTGHMRQLVVGDPADLSTDVGPVINAATRDELLWYIEAAAANGRLICRVEIPRRYLPAAYVGPSLIAIDHISDLPGEVFGPIVHVRRFDNDELEAVCDEINSAGYGLTLGIHTRITNRIRKICDRVRVGNVYANRNMIGAVVESQPFGGCGLSGTGPKAGGPHYVARFATEQTVTVNTTAIGGNAALLTLVDS